MAAGRVLLPLNNRAFLIQFEDAHDLYDILVNQRIFEKTAAVKNNRTFRLFAKTDVEAFRKFTAKHGDQYNETIVITQLNYQ